MSSDPYGDLIGLLLVLAAVLFLAAVVWLLVRKYRAEQSHSLDCTLPKLASPIVTPMTDSSPMKEYDGQSPSRALANQVQNAGAHLPPTVDTIHVHAKESSAAGESPDRLAESASKSTVASKSIVASKSDAGASRQLAVKPQDHPKRHGPPEGGSHSGSRMKRRHRQDVSETDGQRKPPSVAKEGLKMERLTATDLSVAGDHTKPTARLKEHHVSKAGRKKRATKSPGGLSEKTSVVSTRRKQKHHRQETDSAKPSTASKPEVASSGPPPQEVVDVTAGTSASGIASTVATPALVGLATAKHDTSEVAERSSVKSAERSLHRKTSRHAASASCTRVPDVVQDPGGTPIAGGLNPSGPPVTYQAIAASGEATAQDHVMPSMSAGAVELTQSKDASTTIADATALPRASLNQTPDSKLTTTPTSAGTDDFKTATSSPAQKDAGTAAFGSEVDASAAAVTPNETGIGSPSDIPTATAKSVSNSAEGIAKPVAVATDETAASQSLRIADKD
ncbi:uncharacterized protein LOC142589697 [Dermacentor variabilis]|uniref:uncharacterized protein LOC142589697 n=1 Tax=Dermacentor variabilis TaxID=34621 RepID=UPI003F5B5101